jgi:CRISPR system Cascade subunit CasD
MNDQCLVLRLAAPIQSWGGPSEFNRRDTLGEPTKSGIVGMLAAASGRRRCDPIEDLLALRLGVRTDQRGSLLRDYHTVSTLDGTPLLSAQVNAKGLQKRTSPAKPTHVTTRFYLQDAVFVAAIAGGQTPLTILVDAMRRPAFPLALGRRCCPPTQPLLLPDQEQGSDLWAGSPEQVLSRVGWQASGAGRRKSGVKGPTVRLPVTLDDLEGDELRSDVPRSFDPRYRAYTSRQVRQDWVTIPTGIQKPAKEPSHDPFALLGW